jgi:hypothetical protein
VIHWIFYGDVVADTAGQFWVRERDVRASEQAEAQYSAGINKKRGIELNALCASELETFATVYVPTDDIDAQYRLIGCGLKLKCGTPRRAALVVSNPIKWWLLWRRNGERSKLLWA